MSAIIVSQYIPIASITKQGKWNAKVGAGFNNVEIYISFRNGDYTLYVEPVEIRDNGIILSKLFSVYRGMKIHSATRNTAKQKRIACEKAREVADKLLDEFGDDFGLVYELPNEFFPEEAA